MNAHIVWEALKPTQENKKEDNPMKKLFALFLSLMVLFTFTASAGAEEIHPISDLIGPNTFVRNDVEYVFEEDLLDAILRVDTDAPKSATVSVEKGILSIVFYVDAQVYALVIVPMVDVITVYEQVLNNGEYLESVSHAIPTDAMVIFF